MNKRTSYPAPPTPPGTSTLDTPLNEGTVPIGGDTPVEVIDIEETSVDDEEVEIIRSVPASTTSVSPPPITGEQLTTAETSAPIREVRATTAESSGSIGRGRGVRQTAPPPQPHVRREVVQSCEDDGGKIFFVGRNLQFTYLNQFGGKVEIRTTLFPRYVTIQTKTFEKFLELAGGKYEKGVLLSVREGPTRTINMIKRKRGGLRIDSVYQSPEGVKKSFTFVLPSVVTEEIFYMRNSIKIGYRKTLTMVGRFTPKAEVPKEIIEFDISTMESFLSDDEEDSDNEEEDARTIPFVTDDDMDVATDEDIRADLEERNIERPHHQDDIKDHFFTQDY